ncbi:MAG: uracil-DNA glycosylase family protein [Pseudomonadota bacterium]
MPKGVACPPQRIKFLSGIGFLAQQMTNLEIDRSLGGVVSDIRNCSLCAGEMPRDPRPILRARSNARILIASQAPGNKAANSGIPFSDPSGVRLRQWMGVDETVFYNESICAIVPMGFCFPGYDKNGGDMPPMKRCAKVWRAELLDQLQGVELTLVIGMYAMSWHLRGRRARTLTETVRNWREFAAEGIFTLPHPSWRNTAWLKRNPWFEQETLPALKQAISQVLSD